MKKTLLAFLSQWFCFKPTDKYDFFLPDKEEKKADSASQLNSLPDYENIFPNLSINLEYLQMKYNTLINSDIIIRPFQLIAQNTEYKAFLIYIDGMVDSNMINSYILKPLMLRNRSNTFRAEATPRKSITIVKNK